MIEYLRLKLDTKLNFRVPIKQRYEALPADSLRRVSTILDNPDELPYKTYVT